MSLRAIAAALAFSALASSAAAQATTSPPAQPVTPGLEDITAVVSSRGWSPVVSIAVRFPIGSAADPVGMEGRARVAAEGAAAELAETLGGPGVQAIVTPHTTLFTIRARPAEWRQTLPRAIQLLGGAVPASRVRSAVTSHLGRVSFEAGAPLSEFERRFDRLLAGGEAPWTRSADGTPPSISLLDPDAVVAQTRYDGGVVAVVGPVDARDVAQVLGDPVLLPGGTIVAAAGAVTEIGTANGIGLAAGTGSGPWTAGAREAVTGSVMNSWTAAGFPAAPGVSRTELEFLAHIMEERLDPYPPADGVYGLEATVRELPEGPILQIVGTFRPDVGLGWEDKYEAALAELRISAPPSPFFETFLKRFRAASLLAEPSAEDEAVRLASELAAGRVPRDLSGEIAALTPAAVTRAAAALGPPRMLRFGPPSGER